MTQSSPPKAKRCPSCGVEYYKYYELIDESKSTRIGDDPLYEAFEQNAVVRVASGRWFCTVCEHRWDPEVQSSASTVIEDECV